MNPALVARLEQADPKWLFEVVRVDVAGGEVLVCGRLSLKGAGRTTFGSCRMEGRSLGDAANVAAGAALERAAVELGVRVQAETPQGRPANDPPHGNTRSGEKLTAKQLSAIHAICRRRNMPLGKLADMLAQRTGKTAPQFLSKKEASAILDELADGSR